jgi:hypothetical protein
LKLFCGKAEIPFASPGGRENDPEKNLFGSRVAAFPAGGGLSSRWRRVT